MSSGAEFTKVLTTYSHKNSMVMKLVRSICNQSTKSTD